MKVAVKGHYSPAVKAMTDQYFDWDPYNGMFWEEAADSLEKDYRTLEGCRNIIDGNIQIVAELIEDRNDLIKEIAELKRKAGI